MLALGVVLPADPSQFVIDSLLLPRQFFFPSVDIEDPLTLLFERRLQTLRVLL